MKGILSLSLEPQEAALWWLGQAGYIVRASGISVVIDPYLSDSAAAGAPEFTRTWPVPIAPVDLAVDIYIVTHNHLDHLDPDTIRPYPAKATTWFVAPRLTARRLVELGVPADRVVRIDSGESREVGSVRITGVFAVPTGVDVLDTTGYWLEFPNGRNVYHTSDTAVHPLVFAAAPRQPEVMLVPINGKWDNPGPESAAAFAAAVQPRFVLPHHYDLMALNQENPETFRWFCRQRGLGQQCVLAERMQPFRWS